MVSQSVLEVDGVIVEFNNKIILQDVYLKIELGEIIALSGRNGTGKTTLFHIISGINHLDTGTVRINSKFIKPKNRYKYVKILPQYHFMPTRLTVKQVLSDYKIEVADLVSQFPVFKNKILQSVSKLSGGEKRILEVFIVLSSKGDFCILDEPFNFLSPIHIDAVKLYIRKQSSKKGILITDHQIEHLLDVSNKHYMIINGNLALS